MQLDTRYAPLAPDGKAPDSKATHDQDTSKSNNTRAFNYIVRQAQENARKYNK